VYVHDNINLMLIIIRSHFTVITGQPVLAGTHSQEMEDFVQATFYCLHAFADGS